MAEDLQIRIPVTLDTENILAEIDRIKKTITQDSKYHLDVIAKISDNSISVIQGQLSALTSKKYEVNIGTSVSNTQAQMSQIKNQVQSQLTDIQGVVNNSASNIASAINNAINTSTKSFSIDSSITQQMTDYFMRTFDLMEQSKDGTVVVKNEVESLMKQLANVFTTGDTKRIEEYQTQLLTLAETYGKLSTNMEAVQRLELIRSSYDGIGGNINPYYKAEYADAFGSADIARQTFNEVFGIGKWSWNKNTREINGNYLQSDPLGIADSSITDQLITYCNAIIEAKSQLKQKVVDSLSDEQLSYIFQELQKISGIKFPDPSQFTRQMETLKASVKDAYGNIKISYPTYDELAKVYGSDTVNAFMDSLAGSSKQWQIVENSTNATIKSVEQYNSILSQSQAIQKAYDNELKSYSNNVTQQMGDVTTSASTVEKAVTQVQNATAQTVSSLSPIQTQYKTTFENIANVVKVAEDEFRRFGEVSSVSNKPAFTENGIEYYKDFTIQVKAATGEVQKFKYAMQTDERTGNIFYQLQNINEADAGIQKLINDIERAKASFQAKLANFESTNQGLTGGLQSEIQAVQTALNNLSTYDGIKNVEIAFNNLVASSKAITANIKAVGSSLNPIDNAENVISKMPVDIQKLANGFSALKKQPEDADNIIKQLQNDLQKVIELEQQGGKNRAWSEAYKTLQQDLRNSTNYLKLLQETEKSSTNSSSLINNVKSYQTLLQQTADEWKSQGLYIGEVKKQMSSMLNHIGQIKNEAKLQEYVSTFDKLSANVLRLKVNLDAQVESQNKIYQLQTQIAKLGVNDVTNKSYLTQQLADEEKHLQNLQMQSATLKNIVSIAEQETIVYERTAKAREQMVLTTNHQADTQMAKNIEQVDKYATSVENAIKRLNSLKANNIFTNNAGNLNVQNQISQINQLITKFTEAQTTINGMKSTGTIDNTQFANLTSVITDLDTKFREVTSSANALQTQLKQTNGQEAQSGKIKVLISQLEAFAVANSKAMKSNKLLSSGKTVSQEWNAMMSQLKAGADPTVTRQIANNFRVVRNEVKALGLEGSTTFQNLWASIQKFSRWMGITASVSRLVMKVRQAITEIKDLDSILTEISKTSDRTAESLEKLGDSAFEAASKYGRTASDYLTGVQEMSRAGFGEQASEQMAELSLLAQSAGDMEADLANEYLIAMNAAYRYEGNVQTLNDALDRQNYITNRNAVNMEELTNATKVAGSQAAQSGVDIDKMTAAVGTMIATTQEGGETAGRAFKAILMNLRQVSAEADDIGDGGEAITTESLTKYEKACEALGVSLKTVKDGVVALRDPMEILDELATAVKGEAEDSVKVANLINSVGGKLRGNQMISLLRNWDTYKKMLSEFNSEEAIGSALEEANKSANNLQGRLNALSNSFTELVNNFADSNTLKSFVNLLNGILTTVNGLIKNFGTLQTIIPMVFAGLSLKNVGEQNKHARFCTATYNKYRECNTFQNKVVKLLGNAKALQPLIA